MRVRFSASAVFGRSRQRRSVPRSPILIRPSVSHPSGSEGRRRSLHQAKFVFHLAVLSALVTDTILNSTTVEWLVHSTLKLFRSPLQHTSDLSLLDEQLAIYRPLEGPKEIRLLILEPGKASDSVRCCVLPVSLGENPGYEALSYTWGDPNDRREITCCGRRITITTNLHAALSHLRHPDRRRVIWADALCINQEDLKERKQQVKIMGDIYSQADGVLIWLGEETEDVKDTIESIKILHSTFWVAYFRRYLWNRLPRLEPWWSEVLPEQTLPPDMDWKPITNLLSRPYFQRGWIIQEAVKARQATVVCGNKTIPWKTFETVCHSLVSLHNSGQIRGFPFIEAAEGLNSIEMILQARKDARVRFISAWLSIKQLSELYHLLIATQWSQCTDSRDKIFALLGIAQDVAPEDRELGPDYTESVESIFRRFVIWDISKHGNLRTLSCISKPSNLDLPSWVPDLTQLDSGIELLVVNKRTPFQASKGSKAQARWSEQSNVLHLTGKLVDSIQTVGKGDRSRGYVLPDAHGAQFNLGDAINYVLKREWLQECWDIAASTGLDRSSSSDYETFARTMTCNLNYDGAAVISPYIKWFPKYEDYVKGGNLRTVSNPQEVPQWRDALKVIRSVHAWTKGRHFCATERGRIGWVPSSAAEGDLICVFFGGRVPYAIRSCGDGHYTLVGECYIHGIMEGEAMKMKELETEEFALR
ncbi:heterokaryon incompatibility protein-domain-containing protein [Phaeosphaeriaceae sp. PMI808]|nr:heterokaryon incompatibility protein-domain-containing protein [Phaeosphaeriaceae sp. PMI808]